MKTVPIHASRSYNVDIGQQLLCDAGAYIARHISPCRVALVTDSNLHAIYKNIVSDSLSKAGFEVISYVFPAGESSKSISVLSDLLEFLAKNQFTRLDALVAFGGGVVGDLTGFAASVYLRGISFVQIPTTLLAAVDSSVGGKTAINLTAGKNLAGAFWQPSYVLCDYSTFDTLPKNVFSEGVAESLKYGVIFDESLFSQIEADGFSKNCEGIVSRCVEIKGEIVFADEFDKGTRQLLNFGHTLGHAIESCSRFAISHGQAVAIGMMLITRACEKSGLCAQHTATRLESALSRYHLPTTTDFSAEDLYFAALSDKKRQGDKITLVIPQRIGKCVLHTIPKEDLLPLIRLGVSKDK